MGIFEPVEPFTATIIAVIHLENDVENKWVASPFGMYFSKKKLLEVVCKIN